MLDEQVRSIMDQIPEGETFSRFYRAFEGDVRVITTDDRTHEETRYKVIFNNDGSVSIRLF